MIRLPTPADFSVCSFEYAVSILEKATGSPYLGILKFSHDEWLVYNNKDFVISEGA